MPNLYLSVAGVEYAHGRSDPGTLVLQSSLAIRDILNQTPNTCSFTAQGFVPSVGQEIKIYVDTQDAAGQVFGGHVLTVDQSYVGTPARTLYQVTGIDYTWLLNRRLVTKRYTAASGSTIGADLVATFADGFTSTHVAAGLPTVDEITFTDVPVMDALSQLATAIGGYCYVDYQKDVHLFLTETATAPTALTLTHPSLVAFAVTRDISPVITRVSVEGGGGTALTDIAVGETILPVDVASWYNPAGGTVDCGPQRLTYSGVQAGGGGGLVGPGASPSSAPTLAVATGSGVESGAHDYAVTFVTGAGESLPGPRATVTPGTVAAPASAAAVALATGTGVTVGAHNYAVTFVTPSGETTASPVASLTVAATTSPAATLSNNRAGNVPAGAYSWGVTFTTGGIEDSPGTLYTYTTISVRDWYFTLTAGAVPSGTTVKLYRTVASGSQLKLVGSFTVYGDGSASIWDTKTDAQLGNNAPSPLQRVSVSAVPLGPAVVTSRNLYRTVAAGSQLKLLATIADNTTTAYADSTADGSLGANVPTSNTATANQVSLTGIPIGGAGVTSRVVYRTAAAGSQLKLVHTIADNTTSTYTDSTADASLGANAPTSDTSGLTQPSGQALAGATSLIVAGTGAFVSGGGWAVIGNGSQVIRYTGKTGSSLTGIPATGPGAIVASVGYNSNITAAPAITGIPSSSTGSILYAIAKGDQVNLVVTVDDAAAQAAMAALVGGDGVHESFMQDGRLSETEARARGQAQLALLGSTARSITYKVRDANTRSGRVVSVDLPAPTNVVGDFLIQSVTVDEFMPELTPVYTATGASTRFSFEDLLRRMRAMGLQ